VVIVRHSILTVTEGRLNKPAFFFVSFRTLSLILPYVKGGDMLKKASRVISKCFERISSVVKNHISERVRIRLSIVAFYLLVILWGWMSADVLSR
jgi:hypothetical protein